MHLSMKLLSLLFELYTDFFTPLQLQLVKLLFLLVIFSLTEHLDLVYLLSDGWNRTGFQDLEGLHQIYLLLLEFSQLIQLPPRIDLLDVLILKIELPEFM